MPEYGLGLQSHVVAGLVCTALLVPAFPADATIVTPVLVGEAPPQAESVSLVLGFDPDDQPPRRLPIVIGASFEVPSAMKATTAKVECEGFWSEEISLGPDVESAAIRLVKATEVGFPIQAGNNLELPEDIQMSFEAAPSYRRDAATDGLSGSTVCTVRDQTAWCRLPELTLDVRFSAADYAPFYLWNLALAEGRSKQVPALELKTGGTVLGRAVNESGDPVPDADVYLMPPLAARAYDPILAARLRSLAMETSTNERGFFQLVGVPTGSYRVLLEKSGLATTDATPEPLQVQVSEHLLADATMPRAAALVLALTPELDPSSSPWTVLAHPRDSIKHLIPRSAKFLHQSGSYTAEGLVPGNYDLMVKSSSGERWLVEPIEVLPGPQHLEITMDQFAVVGTVMAGDTPVTGRLVLNDGGSEIGFDLDDEGAFSGTLPNSGCWRVQVLPEEYPGVELARPCETVEPVDGVARLEIELPNTRLGGEVVDSLGQPVENARVRIFSKSTGRAISSARSDSSGDFVLLGLAPGPTAIVAEESGRESESRSVQLQEDHETPRLVLTLREKGEVTGQVSAAGGGPVAGARVVVWPEFGPTQGGRVAMVSTDANGAFHAELSADATWVQLIVSAPGYGTRILREARRQDQSLLIEIAPGGGQLTIELPRAGDDDRAMATSAGRAVVAYDGLTIPLLMLRVVARRGPPISQTGQMQLDGMAPGTYSLCAGVADRRGGESEVPGAPACNSVFLPSGGQAVLSLAGASADS